MLMKFKYFAAILSGFCLIGFSLGFILGFYTKFMFSNNFWAYLGAPLLGVGGGLMIYGTLFNRK